MCVCVCVCACVHVCVCVCVCVRKGGGREREYKRERERKKERNDRSKMSVFCLIVFFSLIITIITTTFFVAEVALIDDEVFDFDLPFSPERYTFTIYGVGQGFMLFLRVMYFVLDAHWKVL